MKTIWKYHLEKYRQTLTMPKGARILDLQVQGDGDVQMWAEVDTEAETEERHFESTWTGVAVPEEGEYLATLQVGIFVVHVYEVTGLE